MAANVHTLLSLAAVFVVGVTSLVGSPDARPPE